MSIYPPTLRIPSKMKPVSIRLQIPPDRSLYFPEITVSRTFRDLSVNPNCP